MWVDSTVVDTVLRGAILSGAALLWCVVLIRVSGLRSLSKMAGFEFVMTLAVGSLLAGAAQATSWSAFAQPLIAMTVLFFLQAAIAWLRVRSPMVRRVLDNQPRLLMRDGEADKDALKSVAVTQDDLTAKLREANVLCHDEVCAVVLESTGDISVLHGDALDSELLEGVGESR